MTYVVFADYLNGFFTKGGTYSSDLDAAKEFTREEAIEFCKRRYRDEIFGAIMVLKEDLEAVRDKREV